MTVYRETISIIPGKLTEYYRRFDSVVQGDEYRLFFDKAFIIEDLHVYAHDSLVYDVYLQYPVSQMEMQLDINPISANHFILSQDDAKGWYAVPEGTTLIIRITTVYSGVYLNVTVVGR